MTTTTTATNGTIIVHRDGVIIGWINNGGCEHPACKRGIKAGRMFHAIPRTIDNQSGDGQQYPATLPDYHFTTVADAITAIEQAHGVNS